MRMVDSEGRLFGYVNVVDALVVALTIVVLVASASLFFGADSDAASTDDEFVTLTVGPTTGEAATALSAGTNVTVSESGATLVVTDTFQRPQSDGDGTVTLVRAKTDRADRPLPVSQPMTLRTGQFSYNATLRRTGAAPEIRTTEQTVTVRTTVDRATANAVRVGDQFGAGGHPVARVESVRAAPTTDGERYRLDLRLSLTTPVIDGTPRYLGRQLRVGASIPFRSSSYNLTGRVTSLDASPSRRTNETFRVRWTNVHPSIADAVEPGLRETHRGATARVVNVEREPATVVLQSEGGDIFARKHPVNEDVTLTVEATLRDGQFHGSDLRNGRTVVLKFDRVTVRGTVVGIGDG